MDRKKQDWFSSDHYLCTGFVLCIYIGSKSIICFKTKEVFYGEDVWTIGLFSR